MQVQRSQRFTLNPVVKLLSLAMISIGSVNSYAANFSFGDVDVSFDSTFSYGSSWRIESRKRNKTIGKSNNSANGFDFSQYHLALNPIPSQTDVWDGAGLYSTNRDNANLNYAAGEQFSSIIKGSHDLDVKYENIGLFVRGMYFYDFEMNDGNRDWTNPLTDVDNDPCRDDDASENVCKDIRLLDAFVYGHFDIGEMPLSIRVGQQVISWGESTLISHGISELNPVDIARLRAPGSELKEAFIPFGAVWASLGLTDNVNVEMFYQYSWEETVLPAPGSYFSTNDFAGDGGQYANVQLGFGGLPDMNLEYLLNGNPNGSPLMPQGLNGLGNALRAGAISPENASQIYFAYPGNLMLRGPDNDAINKPEDGEQYGIRLSWYIPELNDIELSFYYMNYHSRRPVFSGVAADFRPEAIGADIGMIAATEITEENFASLQAFSKVKLDYVEDIELYAVSFNTSIGQTSVAGEFSYRQDEPLQMDDVELLYAAVPQQLANTQDPRFAAFNGLSQVKQPDGSEYGFGAEVDGFILSDTMQAQFTLTHLFGPMLGASQFTGLVEVGGIDIRDMPANDTLRLNAPGTDRSGTISVDVNNQLASVLQDGVETTPFPDAFSWGYRVVTKLEYNNVFAGINVSPRMVFAHDVKGTTPDPIFLFVEERKSMSLGLTFDYQSRWSADIDYNAFWDGVGVSNQMEDRDYVSFSLKYSI